MADLELILKELIGFYEENEDSPGQWKKKFGKLMQGWVKWMEDLRNIHDEVIAEKLEGTGEDGWAN